jgi:mannitol-1-phosphate 5-dehydrogenase
MRPIESRKAVVFGAGKMACGLLGHLLAQSGYSTVFVARRMEITEAINRRHGYSLTITGERVRRFAVRDCSALPIHDSVRVAEALADADVVFTAVGADNLAAITPAIAEGLWLRSQTRGAGPLNVIASENLPGAGAYLGHQVITATPLRKAMAVEETGGFSAALTRRIMTGGALDNGELGFTVDEDCELIIDHAGLKGDFPVVQGVTITAQFTAMVMRKLFLLNCAQAAAAYLGYREGCHYVHEAAAHPSVAPVVRAAVAEAQAALKAEFPGQAGAVDRDAAEALARIGNPRLADTISRVARGPRRKLSPRERLVGPARLASQHNLPHRNLCQAIAGALTYDDPSDPQAVAMQDAILAEGVEKVLTEDCGILPHQDLARAVKQQWLALVCRTAKGRPSVSQSGASLSEIIQSVVLDLSRRYDPGLVSDVVIRVMEKIQDVQPRMADILDFHLNPSRRDATKGDRPCSS